MQRVSERNRPPKTFLLMISWFARPSRWRRLCAIRIQPPILGLLALALTRTMPGLAVLGLAVLACPESALAQVTEIPTASAPWGITAGPDGALWFTENGTNKIGRITTAGAITNDFPITTSNSGPRFITAGPDGNLWFTEINGNKIGRITTAGVVTEFTAPTTSSEPFFIAVGPDGNLWFTEYQGNKIGAITTAGLIADFPIPTANSGPSGIAAGPDGNTVVYRVRHQQDRADHDGRGGHR